MNCAAIDKLTLWHASPPARTFHFRRKRRTRGNLKRQSNPRVWRSLLKLLYSCNSTPSPSPSGRIRFNHQIAPTNEKDWLVTGAKSPLIVGLHPRIFAVETIVARTLRGSFITIETTALPGTRDSPDTAWRWTRSKKILRRYSCMYMSSRIRCNCTSPLSSIPLFFSLSLSTQVLDTTGASNNLYHFSSMYIHEIYAYAQLSQAAMEPFFNLKWRTFIGMLEKKINVRRFFFFNTFYFSL